MSGGSGEKVFPRAVGRHVTRIAGPVVFIVALGFLAFGLQQNWAVVKTVSGRHELIAAIALCAVLHVAAVFIMAGAWWVNLRVTVGHALPFAPALRVYSTANVLKYLPGNMFHYMGRQVLAKKHGWSQVAVAAASFWEVLLQAAVATGFCVFFGIAFGAQILDIVPLVPIALGLIVVLASYAAASRVIRLPWVQARIARITRAGASLRMPSLLELGTATTFYAVSLLLTATLAALLAAMASGTWLAWPLVETAAAFVIAWLVGFVSPGAPAGIGVREAVFALLLAGSYDEGVILAVGLAMRVVTVLGDGLAFFVTWGIFRDGRCRQDVA